MLPLLLLLLLLSAQMNATTTAAVVVATTTVMNMNATITTDIVRWEDIIVYRIRILIIPCEK